jgi:hypothetical protein
MQMLASRSAMMRGAGAAGVAPMIGAAGPAVMGGSRTQPLGRQLRSGVQGKERSQICMSLHSPQCVLCWVGTAQRRSDHPRGVGKENGW